MKPSSKKQNARGGRPRKLTDPKATVIRLPSELKQKLMLAGYGSSQSLNDVIVEAATAWFEAHPNRAAVESMVAEKGK